MSASDVQDYTVLRVIRVISAIIRVIRVIRAIRVITVIKVIKVIRFISTRFISDLKLFGSRPSAAIVYSSSVLVGEQDIRSQRGKRRVCTWTSLSPCVETCDFCTGSVEWNGMSLSSPGAHGHRHRVHATRGTG